MADENVENTDSSNGETGDSTATTDTEQVDVEALKAKAAKADELEETNRQLFERAKKAEGFVKIVEDGKAKWVKAPKPEEAIDTSKKLEATTGELSETQLDYLDLKGINDDEDISLIQSVMKRTGQTVRQALSDDYVKSRLAQNLESRKAKNAMPSSTRRTGQADNNDVDYWVAENERSGKLPDSFDLRQKVIAAKESKLGNDRIPPWRR